MVVLLLVVVITFATLAIAHPAQVLAGPARVSDGKIMFFGSTAAFAAPARQLHLSNVAPAVIYAFVQSELQQASEIYLL